MDISVHKRQTGLSFDNAGQAVIQVWAPAATSLDIRWGDHTTAFVKGNGGYWKAVVPGLPPGCNYTLHVNGGNHLPDPASLSQPEGVHHASQAVDLQAFTWTDAGWNNPALSSYIIYELHTGTFTESGDFSGIITRLDDLRELGITAIELMPVAQFPGKRNWGYDGVFPYAVQHNYGGAQGLQDLVDTCHRKGLAVILDVVYNHLGPEGNYLEAFGPYFTDKYHTPWGKAVNLDDEQAAGVRSYILENMLMWFRDFHVDALRLDAVHALYDYSQKHILREMREYADLLMRETGRLHYLIVECDLNDPHYIRPVENQGYGMHAQWTDEFHHALRVAAGEPMRGYYSDYEGTKHVAKAYRDAYVYTGQYSPHRKKQFGQPVPGDAGHQFVVFSQNHDQIGNRMLGERSAALYSFEMQKLLAAAVLSAPYIPLLFMGEEYGETNPFLYFVSHSDPALAEAVRSGRREEFAGFQHEGQVPDPMDPETFLRSRLQWHLRGMQPHNLLLAYYKELIAWRKASPVFRQLSRENVKSSHDERSGTVYVYQEQSGQCLMSLMNFSDREQPLTVPFEAPLWDKCMDSADPVWGGEKASPQQLTTGMEIRLQPSSFVAYTHVKSDARK